jgi:hypothetical protein
MNYDLVMPVVDSFLDIFNDDLLLFLMVIHFRKLREFLFFNSQVKCNMGQILLNSSKTVSSPVDLRL